MKHHLFTMKVSILLDYKIGFLFVSCLECWAYRGPQRHKHVMLYPKLLPKETCTLISDHFPTVYASWFWKVCHYLRLWLLEYNLFLRMYPRDQLFSDKRIFKRSNMASMRQNGQKRMTLYSYSSTLSDMNFQMILMP